MACSHREACPLFPFLNSSLDGWRRCYCDSAEGWRGCARYQRALRGQYVPLSLLPNGHDARHLQHVGADGGSGVEGPGGQPGTSTSGDPTLVDLLFEHAPAAARTPPIDEPPARPAPAPRPPSPSPSPSPAAGAPPPAARPRLREPRPTRSWWKRLTEWMRTPA
jgi:hypothetical protein